jgi:hypothetical protein
MDETIAMERDAVIVMERDATIVLMVIRGVFLLAAAAGFLDSCGIVSALSSVLAGVAELVGR